MQQASCKYETPRLELKSSQTFLAIKRCEGTKFGEVIKQSRSLIYKLGHICATRGVPVNDTCCVALSFRLFFVFFLIQELQIQIFYIGRGSGVFFI